MLRSWFMSEHTVFDPPWLWQDRVPVGGLTVVATPSGGDASPVIADLAARVTAGLAFPGESRPQNVPNSRLARRVVVVTAGGDPRYGIGRQIERAGGRIDQLLVINGVPASADDDSPDADSPDSTSEERSLSFPGDLKPLRESIVDWNPSGEVPRGRNPQEPNPVGLLVIESLPFHVEKWREPELRTLFDRLNRLAVELNIAVVLLTPLTTTPSRVRSGKVTLAKALGSAALVEAAAAIWQIDPLADDSDRYEFVPLKSRKKHPPHAFRLEDESVRWQLPVASTAGALPTPYLPVRTEPRAVQDPSPASKTVDRRPVGDAFQPPSKSEATAVSIPPFPTSPRTEPTITAERGATGARPELTTELGTPSSANAPRAHHPPKSLDTPRARTVAEIRQSPEWKRASRIERKRLLRTAAVGKSRSGALRNAESVPAGADPPVG